MNVTKEINANQLNQHLNKQIDIFICSSSFEERCTIIPNNLNKEHIKNVLIFLNKVDPLIKNEVNIIKNAEQFKSNFHASQIIELSKIDPLFTADQLLISIKKLKLERGQTIVVDITTFTHEALLILFMILLKLKHEKDKIYLIYNLAEEYSYLRRNEDDKWLSKGIKEIRTILGYPGKFRPLYKLHLIVLVGYEYERAVKLIENYEPSILSLGLPIQSEIVNKNIQSINKNRYKKLLTIYNDSNIQNFEFSIKDPILTKTNILTHKNKFGNFNTVIAPMNNKISTLGVGLAAIQENEIQLCYASPNIYNTADYSSPSNKCYMVELNDLIK